MSIIGLILCVAALPNAAANEAQPLADVQASSNLITFEPLIEHSQVRVTVTGPEGFQAIRTFSADESPGIELPGFDGLYKYELRFAPVVDEQTKAALAAARLAGTEPIEFETSSAKATVQSGAFTITDGSVVRNLVEPQPKVVLTNGDGVVRNGLCVGFDCPDAPAFGDSTILMMENNTRIKFGDTSNSPFPNNDWEIEANSSLSGGASYLGFNDCGSADNGGGCATDLVFAVESGARQNALYVESDGDVGIGTSNPVLDLHIVTGNTPSIRLDQDGSSGFTPQVWDIAGNEANFFIRDVTAGSRLPFRIRPGAPTSSIDINGTGRVGIGTASPAATLDVVAASTNIGNGNAAIRLVNPNGAVAFQLDANNDGTSFWNIGSLSGDNIFRINRNGGGIDLELNSTTGNLTIFGSIFTGGGTCGGGCDAVLKKDYPLATIEEHAQSMWRNGYLPTVGPTPENQPVNLTEMTGRMLNELEKAHIYIAELNERLTAKDGELAAVRGQLESLSSLVANRTQTDPNNDQQEIIGRLLERVAALEARLASEQ